MNGWLKLNEIKSLIKKWEIKLKRAFEIYEWLVKTRTKNF